MPEGPEIRREADRIRRALRGGPLTRADFAFRHLQREGRALVGQTVVDVKPRGKAMLVRFSGGRTLYSHNQLYGRWVTPRGTEPPETNRSLRVALVTPKRGAFLYSASDIELLDDDGVETHPFLTKLGPDALDPDTSEASLRERLDDPRFRRRSLAALLLDQSFVAGLGNYLRSDILFAAELRPDRRPADLDDDERERLATEILARTRQSYETRGVTNDLERVADLRSAGVPRRRYRHLTFAREGEPCWTCEGPIVRETLAGRRLYWCPICQR